MQPLCYYDQDFTVESYAIIMHIEMPNNLMSTHNSFFNTSDMWWRKEIAQGDGVWVEGTSRLPSSLQWYHHPHRQATLEGHSDGGHDF